MKRRMTIGLTACVVLLFAGILLSRFYPFRVGQVTDFSYWRGHYWYGYDSVALVVEDGGAWAVEAYEPTDMPGGGADRALGAPQAPVPGGAAGF